MYAEMMALAKAQDPPGFMGFDLWLRLQRDGSARELALMYHRAMAGVYWSCMDALERIEELLCIR